MLLPRNPAFSVRIYPTRRAFLLRLQWHLGVLGLSLRLGDSDLRGEEFEAISPAHLSTIERRVRVLHQVIGIELPRTHQADTHAH